MLPFVHPSNLLIAAASQSGKTHFTIELVRHSQTLFQPPPEKILWCYSMFQESYRQLSDIVHFTDSLPTPESFTGKERTLLILDDMMHEVGPQLEQLFTKTSHHKNLSVIYITQNLFFSPKQRTLSLNSHYIILFKNVRDASQISIIARQMHTTKNGSRHMIEAYNDATNVRYGYLVMDLRPETEDKFRLRTNILPGQDTYVYVAK